MRTITFGNYKGGCGKTTLAHHLALLADEAGLRVVAVDTDRQGDLYRRLTNASSRAQDRPPAAFGRNGSVMYSPGGTPPASAFGQADLLISDTPPSVRLSDGRDAVVVPIDGIDAALNANEAVADALDAEARLVVLVRNGTTEGGKRFEREFAELEVGLPERVVVCPVTLLRGDGVKRTSLTNRAAWTEPYKGADTRAMREACDWILRELFPVRKRGAA